MWTRKDLETHVCDFDGHAPHAWMPRARFNTPWRCGDCGFKVMAKHVEPLPPPAEEWLTLGKAPSESEAKTEGN